MMNYPFLDQNLVYFFRDMWVTGMPLEPVQINCVEGDTQLSSMFILLVLNWVSSWLRSYNRSFVALMQLAVTTPAPMVSSTTSRGIGQNCDHVIPANKLGFNPSLYSSSFSRTSNMLLSREQLINSHSILYVC